jgi:hypothetical protein
MRREALPDGRVRITTWSYINTDTTLTLIEERKSGGLDTRLDGMAELVELFLKLR